MDFASLGLRIDGSAAVSAGAQVEGVLNKVTGAATQAQKSLDKVKLDPKGVTSGSTSIRDSMKDLFDGIEKTRTKTAELIREQGNIGSGIKTGASQARAEVDKLTISISMVERELELSRREKRALQEIGLATDEAKQKFINLSRYIEFAERDLKELGKQKDALKGIGAEIEKKSGSFITLGNAIRLVAASFAAREYVESVNTFQRIDNKLSVVSKSTRELAVAQDQLFKVAQQTRSGWEETVELYSRVARNADQLGISQQRLIGLTKTVNQAIQIGGSSPAEASAGVLQLSQALASGVLRGDELRSVLENMPVLAKAIADGLGVSVGKLRELGTQGKLTADDVIRAIERNASSIDQQYNKMSATLSSSWTTLKNSIIRDIGLIDRAVGSSKFFSGALSGASKVFDSIGDAFDSKKIENLEAAKRITEKRLQALQEKNGKQNLDFFSSGNYNFNADIAKMKKELDDINKRIDETRKAELGIGTGIRGGGPFRPTTTGVTIIDPKADAKRSGELSNEILRANIDTTKRLLENDLSNFKNYESVLDSLRKSGLVTESEYYDAKRKSLEEQTDARVNALNKEISLIQQEDAAAKKRLASTTGLKPEEQSASQLAYDKSHIENLQRIGDLRAEITKLEAEATTQTTLLNLEQADGVRNTAKAYREARDAAQAYLDVQEKQQRRSLKSIGKGSSQREHDQGINSIEDKFAGQIQQLESDRRGGKITKEQYDQELDIIKEFQNKAVDSYERYWQDLKDRQGDFTNGMRESIAEYTDNASNVAGQSKELFTHAFKGMEDSLIHFVQTGKFNFKSLADSIVQEMLRMQIQALALKFLGIGGGLSSTAGSAYVSGGGAMLAANGAAFDHGNPVTAFAMGGVVDKPTGFTFNGGQMGVMGEAGTEGIFPLRRNSRGQLGVMASGGGPSVVVNNNAKFEAGISVAQMNAMLERNNKQLEAAIIDNMRRGVYGKVQ